MVMEFYSHDGVHPIIVITSPAIGSRGISVQQTIVTRPKIHEMISVTKPKIIIKLRTMAPMQRETSRSMKACHRTPIGPATCPAEIWRNGANNVFRSKPIEK